MPFQIIRADITKVKADAIVNTANPAVAIGDGVDSAIYNAAGREELFEERKKIGTLEPGEVGITPAFDLDAKYIIHASGPGGMAVRIMRCSFLGLAMTSLFRWLMTVDARALLFRSLLREPMDFPRSWDLI